MDQETREMFNVVIGEFDKLTEKMNLGFAKLDVKIDYVNESLTHEINACKLDRDIMSLLVDKAEEHEKRLSALETRVSYELV